MAVNSNRNSNTTLSGVRTIDRSIESFNINELYYLVQRFLDSGPCIRTAQSLREEIDENALITPRIDYTGQRHARTFIDYHENVRHIVDAEWLPSMCRRARQLIDNTIPPCIDRLPSTLIANGRQSLLRTNESVQSQQRPYLERIVHFRCALHRMQHARQISSTNSYNSLQTLIARQLSGTLPTRCLLPKETLSRLELHCRLLGHLASVFCVTFDRTGEFIFTGADDNLIKVWSSFAGTLRFTFRGHHAEITDLTISFENTVLASASIDKTVRVWCLITGATLAVYRTHSSVVTQLSFLPYVYRDDRYLMSTGNDCCVCFYLWNASTNDFGNTPTKFNERATIGARMISHCYSPGGNLVTIGCTDHYIRIFRITSDCGVVKLFEKKAHTDRVDTLAWAHNGLRFASGSKDGLAKLWTFSRRDWSALTLKLNVVVCKKDAEKENKNNKYKVTMLCWTLNDDAVITAGSDHILRVWDSTTGTHIRTMLGHNDESIVLVAHPLHHDVVLSAGHDGCLLMWDYTTGAILCRHQNRITNNGCGPFFDACFSPNDGSLVAAVDWHGHLSIFGIGSNHLAKTMPKEQFFHTDYRPLIVDANGYTLDEQTQLAPNVMPPPVLVDADNRPYSAEQQRFVPGRDRLECVASTNELTLANVETARSHTIDLLPASSTAEISRADSTPICAWQSRSIVRPLQPSMLAAIIDRLTIVGDTETALFLEEYNKDPLPTIESALSTAAQRLRKRRQSTVIATVSENTTVPHAYTMRSNRRPLSAYRNDEFVDPQLVSDAAISSSSDTSLSLHSSTNSSMSDSDSDYPDPIPITRPLRRSSRTRTRIVYDNDDQQPSTSQRQLNNGASSSTRIVKRRHETKSSDHRKIPHKRTRSSTIVTRRQSSQTRIRSMMSSEDEMLNVSGISQRGRVRRSIRRYQ